VRLRKEAGLNQAVLAARLRITQSEVSKYERGERILSEARLHAWLSALTPPAQESPVAGPTPSLGPAGLAPVDCTGLIYHPLLDEWRTGRDTDVNYIAAYARAV